MFKHFRSPETMSASVTFATYRALEFDSQSLRDRERGLRPTRIHGLGRFVQCRFSSIAAHHVRSRFKQIDQLGQLDRYPTAVVDSS